MISREQNRAWAMTMAVAAVLAYTTGCADNNSSSTAESTQTTAATSELESESTTTDSEHSESTVATPLSDSEQRVAYDDDDKTSTYDTFDAEITLSGTTADVTGNTNAVSVSDRTVTIQNGGTYRITGTWKDGQLRVTGSEKVKLYFDGVSITNSNGAALSCENEKRTILSLAANTENSLSDGAASDAATDGETAALFTEDKLTINGSGTLTVTGNAANGIVCRDDLKITDGTISVTAANNGIKGKDSIGICGGTITIDAQNDGLKTTKADDPEQGWIAISGGTLNITAKGDGIQAETDCYIDGGTLNVTTTGEIAVSTSDDQPFGGGGFGGGFDNGQSPFDGQTPPQGGNRPDGAAPMEKPDDATGSQPAETAPAVTTTTTTTNTEATTDTDTNTTAAEDASSKGIKAGNALTITGGTIQANTTDHCMHSDGAFTCSGGTLELSSSMAKGISSHGDLAITDGSITIDQATEGIESKADMNLAGGTIRILQATNDGLNTGGGTGMGMGFPMGQPDGNQPGDPSATTAADETTTTETTTTTTTLSNTDTATDTAEESHELTISGGTIYICADGDGIDSNGSITMTGGTVFVSGPVSGGDGAIDFETDMTMTGGSILALSSRGMMEYPSTQYYYTTSISANAGDFIAVCDADGNVLMGMQTQKAVSDVVYYGDQMDNCQLIVDGTYSGTLSDDGTATDGTVSGGTVADSFQLTDGSEQSSASGNFGDKGGTPPNNGEMPTFADGEQPEPPQGGFGNGQQNGGNGAPTPPQGGQPSENTAA